MADLMRVHVVWHPWFSDGKRYAERIFTFFQSDPEHPVMRGLGMPVSFWTAPPSAPAPPAPLDLGGATHNAVFLLFDETFASDSAWKAFAESTQNAIVARGDKDRMFAVLPVQAVASQLPANMHNTQGIALWDEKTDDEKLRKILVRSSVALARALVSADEKTKVANLFLSHAKHDEKMTALAASFRDYVRRSAPFKSFYDAQDLIAGEDWKTQLRESVEESAVIVFQTDVYSTRPICHYEVLAARYADRPIVNVHAVVRGELRIFPYLGNVPSIHYAADNVDPFGPVLDLVTFEVLRSIYVRRFLREIVAVDPSLAPLRILFRPPDLVACANFSEPGFLYPDPPLGAYELELLRKLNPNRIFLTPDTRPLLPVGGTP